MKLNLIEQFLLIALDDDKGRFVTDTTYLYNGFAGAILMELTILGKIELRGKNVSLLDSTLVNHNVLDQSVNAIKGLKKEKSVAFWIGTFNANAKDIQNMVLNGLIQEGILRKEKGRILWVIPYTTYPTENPVPENKVRTRIEEVILHGSPPEARELMLLSLLDVCQLTKEAFRDNDALKIATKRIKELTKNEEENHNVDHGVVSMQDEVISATLSAVIASTSA